MIKIDKMSKAYGNKPVLKDVSFEVTTSQIILILGKSGIGKSTLLDLLAGVKSWDSGHYFFDDKELFPDDDVSMSAFRNRYIGYILQDFALIDDYTVFDNILLPTLYSKEGKQNSAQAYAKRLLEQFGLANLSNQKASKLSGGQKQRVAIIRSLILNPTVILADEPTANLDTENYDLLTNLFQELKEAGKIILIASHDHRLLDIADKVYEIKDFKLLEEV